MHLFIYSELDQHQQAYLLEHLPTGITPFLYSAADPQQGREAFSGADLLLGNPPADWFTGGAPSLKFWQLDSAGFDQYQRVQVSATVANMGNFFAEACAETMVAGILALYRGLPTLVKLQQEKVWQGKQVRFTLELLSRKSVVILGAGTIGLAAKKMLEGFGANVLMTARHNPTAQIHSREKLLQHLPHTDIVINTLPGNLHHYVNADFIGQMKKGSLYANVGRGNTTDETALIKALEEGHLGGAVLDVTQVEPLPQESPLWQMENVLLTQHTGGGQAHEVERKIDRFLANLQRFSSGQEIRDQVSLSQGY
ncbi:D-2-hydroxyacid dehydrogenase [Rufibacter psychrotolerans]|uniref:D-2-hydroxyacid dehydrogenase n=1 Tax=Rufibacter psychrotolerans TaxID=2812556 RepID=UPI0019685527|nr:D-2-hydroxyacid dehydrogenase [Rufibacter sp. SYSU D00308]